MDRYCVMGHPVAHSRSPRIHTRFAELTGQALDYGRRLVPLDGFAQAVADFAAQGGRGCNVTVPFKFEAFALATRHSERATLAQACNTLTFSHDPHGMPVVHADNTDGVGLVNDIVQGAATRIAGHDVLLIGAGGAAAGVLGPLLAEAPRQLLVVNRSIGRAQTLVARHEALAQRHQVALAAGGLNDIHGGFDIVINASASSLNGTTAPVPAHVLRGGALAYDMMYGPAAAPFLDWAQAHGALPRDGLGMLVAQAAEAFALWRGVRPPSAQVLAELRAEGM